VIKPQRMNLVTAPMFLCGGRRGEAVQMLRCTACGWWGEVNDPDEQALFPEHPEHTEFECRRRQTDPDFVRAQTQQRLREVELIACRDRPTPPIR
jgi:hypothetical protein